MSPRRKLAQGQDEEPAKRRKTEDVVPAVGMGTADATAVKSKKQLRLERKALKKEAAITANKDPRGKPLTKEQEKAEKIRVKKERRKEYKREQERLLAKERMKERKLRLKKKQRQPNAPVGAKDLQAKTTGKQKTKASKQTATIVEQELGNRDLDIFRSVLHGSTDATTGMTTLRLGVQYKDIKVGSLAGPAVQNRSLVTVAYKLRPLGSLNVLDSSKNFKFRVGLGEVIQGWDIGIVGMRPGGIRHLIVPPKAGYGSQDIGAGSGSVLAFEITLLSC